MGLNQSGERLRLLIVEDNPGDLHLIRSMLSELAVVPDVVSTSTMDAAQAALRSGQFDVALLDLRLPRHSGLETFLALSTSAPQLPVIIMTGTDDEDLAVRCVREGAQDYLVKDDIRPALLVRAIRYAIERKATEASIRELSGEIIRIQEEERNRLAREIHDVLGQALVALKLQIQNVVQKRPGDDSLKQDCTQVSDYINGIIGTARELSHSLSPASLNRLGWPRAIEELVHRFAAAHQVQIETDVSDAEGFFPDNWDINAYRTVQEAIFNAIRHASAARINVRAVRSEGRLRVSVRDDGRGLDATHPPESSESSGGGMGVTIMRERVRLIGGRLEIRSDKSGTEVSFELERSAD